MRRGRDRFGRPVPADAPEALPDVPDRALPEEQALALARALLAQDRAFAAHEVLEASWKAAPERERAVWQGLAQVCVGVTHLQRGNRVGAARLLRRGAERLDPVPAVRDWARLLADEVDGGRVIGPWDGAGGRLVLPDRL